MDPGLGAQAVSTWQQVLYLLSHLLGPVAVFFRFELKEKPAVAKGSSNWAFWRAVRAVSAVGGHWYSRRGHLCHPSLAWHLLG